MKVQLRKLLNPLILNNVDNIGFQGDSEYIDENGDLKLGAWSFITIDSSKENAYILNDNIEDSELYKGKPIKIINDQNIACIVLFNILNRG